MPFEIIEYILVGMSVGFEGFSSTLPIYNELSSIKELLISLVTGIPFAIVSSTFLILSILNIALRLFRKR